MMDNEDDEGDEEGESETEAETEQEGKSSCSVGQDKFVCFIWFQANVTCYYHVRLLWHLNYLYMLLNICKLP